jgi:sigma-B regulation protein RsbU (phosphoserine phosphatase)
MTGLLGSAGRRVGKGVGASLPRPASTPWCAAACRRTCTSRGCSRDLNTHLIDSSADEIFALVVARIVPATGRVVRERRPPAAAGGGTTAHWLDEGGPLAGVIPGARYVAGEVRLGPGDMLAIYSDGVTEAERAGREMFGDDRLLSAVVAVRDRPAADVLAAVLQAVEGFAGVDDPADDISIIVVRRLA